MSLRDDLLNGLIGYAVYKVTVDRDSVTNGSPSTKVTVYRADGRNPHEFTFAKANGMDGDSMVSVIKSYLRRIQ